MVSWQPKPCCLGPGLPRAESRAEESGEKEQRHASQTQTQQTEWITFPPSLGTGAVFYFVPWAEEHGHEDGFFWWKVDRDQEDTVSQDVSDRQGGQSVTFTCDLTLLSQGSPSAHSETRTMHRNNTMSRTGSWLSHGKRVLYIFLHLYYGGGGGAWPREEPRSR